MLNNIYNIQAHPMPCIVHPMARLLLHSGKWRRMDCIKQDDKVIDAEGRPRRVLSARHTPKNMMGYDPYYVKNPSFSKQATYIPHVNYLLDENDNWRHVQFTWPNDETINLKRIQPVYDLPTTFSITWPLGFEKNAEGKFVRKLEKIRDSYELGFVLGAFMTQGSLYEGAPNVSQFFCVTEDAFYLYKLLSCLHKLGIKAKYIDQEETEQNSKQTYHYTRLRILSPNLHGLNTIINQNQRALPASLLSTNLRYLRGIYDGIIEGHQMFFTEETHDIFRFAYELCYPEQNPDRFLCVHKAQDVTAQMPCSLLFTETDKPFTSVICNAFPMATFVQ